MGFGTTEIILLSNALVTIGLFLATLYRIKIEKSQIEVLIENAKAAETLRELKNAVVREEELIRKMSGEEFIDFLKKVAG